MSPTDTPIDLAASAPAESQRIDERFRDWAQSYNELPAYESWLLREACTVSIRLERAEGDEAVIRERFIARAKFAWDDDKNLAVEELGAGIARRPERVVHRLKTSLHGCLWLIQRWQALDAANAAESGWTKDQHAMALDMLGTPIALRGGLSAVDPSDPSDAPKLRAIVVSDQLKMLQARVDGRMARLDRAEQSAAESGAGVGRDPVMKAHRRFLSECRRRMAWCLDQLATFRKTVKAAPVETKPISPPSDPITAELNDSLADFDIDDEDSNTRVDDAITAYLARVEPGRRQAASVEPVGNRHARRAAAAMDRRSR